MKASAIVINDKELADTIKRAFNANPEITMDIVKLMVDGCEQVERFKTNLEIAQIAPHEDTEPTRHDAALQELEDSFAAMIDIFGELLSISTALTDAAKQRS